MATLAIRSLEIDKKIILKKYFSFISEISERLWSSQHAPRILHLLGFHLEAICMADDLKTISEFYQSRQMFEELLVREKYNRRGGLLRGPGHNPNTPRPL